MSSEDIPVIIFLFGVLMFLVFCFVLGARRWRYIQDVNAKRAQAEERALALSEQATADRKKMLVVLDEIKTLLEDRKS